MSSKKKMLKICDNFFGIKWDEKIDNALRIFSKMKNLTVTNIIEKGDEVRFISLVVAIMVKKYPYGLYPSC